MPRELTHLPVFHTPKPPARRRWLVLAACALAGCIGWSGITAAPADTGPSGGIKAEDILPPERAFPVRSVRGASGSSSLVTLQWDIAPGYYLYRSRFRFEPADPWLQIRGIDFPRGESKHDEFFGRQEIYRGRLVIPLHATFSADQRATLVVTAQGCADIGICFPPHQTRLDLLASLPIAPGRSTEPPKRSALLGTTPDLTASSSLAPQSSPAPRPATARPVRGLLSGTSQPDGEFLHPDQAFVPTATLVDPRTLRLTWDIVSGYYLYRDKLKIEVTRAQEALPVAPPHLPRGTILEDEYFGRVETYRNSLAATVDLATALSAPDKLEVTLTYQGCADAGLCYPPVTKRFRLSLARLGDAVLPLPEKASTRSAGASSPIRGGEGTRGAALSEQDRIARTLSESNLGLVIATFFGFGLLLAFTPCVLPMVPILSSILIGEKNKSRGYVFSLSAVYVGAMAITYALVGVLAGSSGANLQIFFQHPVVLVAFAAVFVGLSASMFGLYELQLPTSWQSRLADLSARQRTGSLAGAGIMGLLSALIVGPCVAAPLAGALIYIGQTGDAMLGGIALLCLGLGMGMPLLAIGASAGSVLPRVGPWMEAIKGIFGFVLLGVAVYLLERVLPGWISLALWSVLIIVAGKRAGAFGTPNSARFGWARKSVGAALLTYGAVVMVGAATGGEDVLRPLGPLLSPEKQKLEFRDIKGVTGLEKALVDAARTGRSVMLDYYADWCVSCKKLERETFRDPSVQAVLADVHLLRTDVTRNDEEDQALLKRFDLFGPPAILFFGPDGEERTAYRVVGYMAPKPFSAHATRALGQTRISAESRSR